ncbi:Uncharacterised protein [Shigella sonnei]|nr:Uncharacterised protein [Shigella sonnei]
MGWQKCSGIKRSYLVFKGMDDISALSEEIFHDDT